MTLVAGVDSSTQSCKVVIRDAETGALVRTGAAPHPNGTEIDPSAWWRALLAAVEAAGGVADVEALAVGAQQHGMVCLDDSGAVVRDALLWNDTRSAGAARDLVAELPGGAEAFATRTGSVPVASFTVTKLRWLAEHEPDNAARTAAVCLPHDWLTWRLRGADGIESLSTDRGDASGTGYWSASEGYLDDVLVLAMGRRPELPAVLGPSGSPGATSGGVLLGAGTGDNAAAALGIGAVAGDVVVSIGTSGVVSAVSEQPSADPSGLVAGFADATGHYLPLACTLNGARVLSSTAMTLGVSLDRFAELALSAPPGCDGLVLVPYLEGERTPNRPDATAALHGVTLANLTPAHLARAAIEGLLCGLADGLDALRATGAEVHRLLLIGGGARSQALQAIAPSVFGVPVLAPAASEYVADGAARQAAWALAAASGTAAAAPDWTLSRLNSYDGELVPQVRERYAEARELTLRRIG